MLILFMFGLIIGPIAVCAFNASVSNLLLSVFEEFLLLSFMDLLLPIFVCVCLSSRILLLEACCDLVEPVMGHSSLLWTVTSLSYVDFLHFRISLCLCLSLSLSHTHTHTHGHKHMLVGDIADSDRVISHLIVNRLKIPQGLPTLLFHWWSD